MASGGGDMSDKVREIEEIIDKVPNCMAINCHYQWKNVKHDIAQAIAEHFEGYIPRTELDAWHKVFGTTQLTHAKARLDEAEKRVYQRINELETELKRIGEEGENDQKH